MQKLGGWKNQPCVQYLRGHLSLCYYCMSFTSSSMGHAQTKTIARVLSKYAACRDPAVNLTTCKRNASTCGETHFLLVFFAFALFFLAWSAKTVRRNQRHVMLIFVLLFCLCLQLAFDLELTLNTHTHNTDDCLKHPTTPPYSS